MADEQNGDLPLMSNVDDILVMHYNFSFKCDFSSKRFTCCALLFLKAVESLQDFKCSKCHFLTAPRVVDVFESADSNVPDTCHVKRQPEDNISNLGFVMVLDCHQIIVNKVEGFDFPGDTWSDLKILNLNSSSLNTCDQLKYSVSDWSLKIWKDSSTCKHCFPKVIRIEYETVPSSPSLLWVKDQEGNPAVFCYGSFINNRALFPCQEPPIAMATWEAVVSVSDSLMVLMSGDEEPAISYSAGFAHYYYHTRKALPLSTLCFAIGSWKGYTVTSTYNVGPRCRIFACSSLLKKSIQEFSDYIPLSVKTCEQFLGTYPFSRIDFLLVPSTFGSLGMASPNLVFLSQSLLAGDGSFCSRISHEIAHGWFGLSIGAFDWTEEWLSEGFATFVEDVVHVKINNMEDEVGKEYMELKAFIRRKTLTDEIKNTNEELQILRSSFGEVQESLVDGMNAPILKNGQNPMKNFIQVHYIKGYFLLKHLCDTVGLDSFMNFLRIYVIKFEGQLVTSKEFLNLFFHEFSVARSSISVESIYEKWLHNSGVVLEVENFKPSSENKLYRKVLVEVEKWRNFNSWFCKKKPKRKKLDQSNFSSQLTSEQVVLLLENLLDLELLSTHTLKILNQVFHFKNSNAEVQHRWFELVVKYKYKCEYPSLRSFLTDHLAMGVYLYGEMIYSGNKLLMAIAQEIYSVLKNEMEPNYKSTIDQMFRDSGED